MIDSSPRPVLAIAYGEQSASALKLFEPARARCDIVWVVDSRTFGDTGMFRLLRKLGAVVDVAGLSEDEAAAALAPFRPDGIVAYADSEMATASSLAGRLGLDYHDAGVTERLVDKLSQRRALSAAGLPVPRCAAPAPASTAADLDAQLAGFEFPVVLKPRHGAASRDTVLAADHAALAALWTQGRSDGSGAPMVIEEYMAGAWPPPSAHFADYLSVESVVAKGTIHHLAVTGRMHQVEPFRETGLIIPSDFPPAMIEEALGLASRAVAALGVHTGCFHTEIKATTTGLRVLEVNGRIGGFVAEVLALASPDVDLFEISQRIALGDPVAFDGVVPTPGVGYVLVEQPPMWARRVVAVDGLDRLAAFDGVSSVFLSRQPGDAVDWRKGSHEYVWSVLGAAPDHDGVLAMQQFVDEAVTVTYE